MAQTILTQTGYTDTSGNPLVGGKVYGFDPGTSTAKNTYPTRTDAENSSNPNAHPVILDDYGWAQIWLDGEYKIRVDDASGNTVRTIDEVGDVSDVSTLAKGAIAGLITSNNVSDTEHYIDIAPGECRDFADTIDMTLASALTKRINEDWAEGNDAGGFPSGLSIAANTRYSLFLIAKADGTTDAGFDTSGTASNLLSDATDYTKYRLIGSVVTDASSNIVGYTQVGDYFRYTGDMIEDVVDSSITAATFVSAALSVPPSAIAHIYGLLSNSTTTDLLGTLWIRTKGAAESTGDAGEALAHISTAAVFKEVTSIGQVLVDETSQIEYACSEGDGAAVVNISTIGFTMLSRRDP